MISSCFRRLSRRLPTGLVLGLAVVVAAGTAKILDLVHAAGWLRIVAAVVIAGCGIASELDKARDKKRAADAKHAEEAATEAERLRALQLCVVWPPPRLREEDPFGQLGVATSQLAERYVTEGQTIPPYVERDIDQRVRKRLRSDGMVLLIGAPGSGVTRTAYQAALSVPGSPLRLAPLTPRGLSTALNRLDVTSRLERNCSWLLWLDGVDSFTDLTPDILYHMQKQSPGSRVLATISSSRFEVWAARNQPLASAFGDPVRLERLASDNELRRAEEAYPGVDFSEGVAAAFMATAALMARKRGGFHDCPFEAARDECALARAIVDIALDWSYTDVQRPLSVDQLRALAGDRPAGRRGIDDDHWAAALGWVTAHVLGDVSLLTLIVDESPRTVAAAAQIVEVHRAESEGPDQSVWSAALELAVQEGDSAAIGRIGLRAHVVGYWNGAERAWATISAIDDPATTWLQEAASFSNERGDPAGELPPRQRLYELARNAYGPNDTRVARALSDLGAACRAAGQADRAADLLRRALEIQERECGSTHAEAIATRIQLAIACIVLGKPVRARELVARAPEISEEDSRPHHLDAASTLLGLGQAYWLLGDSVEARDAVTKALKIQIENYGPDHPMVATTLSDLSNTYNALGDSAEARKLLERALMIQERKLDNDHLDIATTLTNFGNTLVRLGEVANAREPLERALRIRESRLSEDDLLVAQAVESLGIMWIRLGDPARGRSLLKRVLAIEELQLSSDRPDRARILMHLSDACFDLQDYAEAGDLLEQVLAIQEAALDLDHPDLVWTLSRLSNTRLQAGAPDNRALPLLERAMDILRRRYPDGHPKIAELKRSIRRIVPGAIIFDNGVIARGTTDDMP